MSKLMSATLAISGIAMAFMGAFYLAGAFDANALREHKGQTINQEPDSEETYPTKPKS